MNEADKQALLDQLREVRPPEVSAWPAFGWWLLLLCVVSLALVAVLSYRRYLANRWQREASLELQRLRDQVALRPVHSILAECSQLARRVLLVVHGRTEVASLHGKPWLEALDAVCQQPLFTQGFGHLLESGPYQRDPQVGQHDLESLFDAVEELIRSAARSRSNAAG
jgi:hypothetical protein